MLKKILKSISLIIVPFLIVICIFAWYDNYLNNQIDALYNSEIGRTCGISEMNNGLKILEHNAKKNDLIILGSSELSSIVPQNPKYMFPNTQLNCDVDLIGQGHVQDLSHAIRIGALSESLQGKKVVLLVSLQWFLGEDISSSGYSANFSEIQFYNFMGNPDISNDIKQYVCDRTAQLIANASMDRPYVYAYLYHKNNIFSNIALTCLKPYYFVRKKFLSLKDKYQAYKVIKKYADSPVQEPVEIDWEQAEAEAQKMGEEACTNNKFNADDKYYDTYLKEKITDLKNSNENISLLTSKEWHDYEILLEICKETGIEPYIIFMPTNGLYYDYIGITEEERLAFYDNLSQTTEKYGYSYLDLRDKEYEPYFLKDVMHLGWKGWLYVNEKITEYYS